MTSKTQASTSLNQQRQQPPPLSRTLLNVSHKLLPLHPARPRLTAYNPTMDLVAVVGANDDVVSVFRLNGERVLVVECAEFGPEDEEDEDGDVDGGGNVKAVAWKRDGHLLAIVCADNNIRLVSAYSGKTVHVLPITSKSTSSHFCSVTCLGWGVNLTDGRATQKIIENPASEVSLDDLLASSTKMLSLQALKKDLPREMALLDVEGALPKLSTLLSMGGSDDVFSSRASVDAIFHAPNRGSDESVDIIIAGLDDGTLHLRIFDCFEIGNIDLSRSLGTDHGWRPILHTSHPFTSTHALLLSSGQNLRLLTLDLCFITNSGRYLSLLASKSTQLQNLLRYINQVEKQIRFEWKNAQDLPARFMRSANMDLEEKCQTDFVTAAFHLLITGDCSAVLKEFLVDIVGERGHKRWERAVALGYDSVRRLTLESLLPALERCSVLLSRLIGLSKYHHSSHVLGLETQSLTNVIDMVDALSLLGHSILINCGTELRQFAAFSRWLRHQIDLQAADPTSQSYDELVEKTDMVDYAQTLGYIQGPLTKSRLPNFIRPALVGPGADLAPAPARPDVSYETYKKAVAEINQKGVTNAAIPKLNDLIGYMSKDCDVVFEQIAETQRRNILHSSPLVLASDCDVDALDLRMCAESIDGKDVSTIYIATRSKARRSSYYIYRVTLDSINNISSTRSISTAVVDFGDGEIVDIKFVDDDYIMAIWSFDKG